MNWLLGGAMLFCGVVMTLDGRADGNHERESPGGGAALFIVGLVVSLSGGFVLIGAVYGAITGAG